MSRLLAILLFALLGTSVMAQTAVSPERLARVKAIWAPAFEQMTYANVLQTYQAQRAKKGLAPDKNVPTEAQFELLKEAVFETVAEEFTESDLELQQKAFTTVVGYRILKGLSGGIVGQAAEPITREQFTAEEWAEWEAVIRANGAAIEAMGKRIALLPQALAPKLSRLFPEMKQ